MEKIKANIVIPEFYGNTDIIKDYEPINDTYGSREYPKLQNIPEKYLNKISEIFTSDEIKDIIFKAIIKYQKTKNIEFMINIDNSETKEHILKCISDIKKHIECHTFINDIGILFNFKSKKFSSKDGDIIDGLLFKSTIRYINNTKNINHKYHVEFNLSYLYYDIDAMEYCNYQFDGYNSTNILKIKYDI